jgi:iron complex outermembrane recepter protein
MSGTYYNIKYDSRIVGAPFAAFLASPNNRAVYSSLITVVQPAPGCIPGNLATAPAAIREALTQPAIPTTSVAGLPGLGPRSFLYGIENITSSNLCDVRAILDGRVINSANTEQHGIDLSVSYAFDALSSFWNVGFAASKILSSQEQIFTGAPVNNALDRINFPVDPRVRANFNWNRGAWGVALYGNYVGSYTNDTPITIAGVVQPNTRIPSWTTADLNLSYSTPTDSGSPLLEGVRIGLTVQNLFDRDPPIVLTGTTANDARNHNPLGRELQFTVTKRF